MAGVEGESKSVGIVWGFVDHLEEFCFRAEWDRKLSESFEQKSDMISLAY